MREVIAVSDVRGKVCAVMLAVCLVSCAVASDVIAGALGQHDCDSENCPVCACLSQMTASHEGGAIASAASDETAYALLALALAIVAVGACIPGATPVSRHVRIEV